MNGQKIMRALTGRGLTTTQAWNLAMKANLRGSATGHGVTVTRAGKDYRITGSKES